MEIETQVSDLKIEGNAISPSVSLDPKTNKIILKGSSIMVEAHTFYLPIIKWAEEYCFSLEELWRDSSKDELRIEILINLNVINLSSFKYLFQIMKRFDDLLVYNGIKVTSLWHYSDHEELIKLCGLEMKKTFSMDFKLFEK